MIPKPFIDEWRNHAPWTLPAQVEQDLIINRAIVDLYNDQNLANKLAFRGGTALHKLHINPAARYSEDLDFVQIKSGPIGPIMGSIKECLNPWLGKPK